MRIQRYDSLTLRDFRAPYVTLPKVEEMAAEPPPPPPPLFSLEELHAATAAAKQESYAEGVKAGITQAETEQAKRHEETRAIMGNIQQEFSTLQHRYDTLLHQQQRDVTELVTLIARQVASDALDRRSHLMIEAMIARCLPAVMGKPRIVIEVHPEVVDLVQSQIIVLFREASYDGDLTVRAGAHVARHDVRVDWQNGHAERNTEALWGNIRRLMQEISIEISTTDSTPSSTD
jgi:flagellar assembly protein FliH